MTIENPLAGGADRAQHTLWKHLKNDTKYDITLILPFKALIQEYGREGGYFITACKVMKDSPLTVMQLYSDDFIIMDLPVRVFQRCWDALPRKFKSDLTEEKNVRIHFIRKTQKDMSILHATIEECSGEEREFAMSIYDNSRAYVKKEFHHHDQITKNEEE